MYRIASTLAVCAFLASPAAAQQPYNWQGLYLGIHGGYAQDDWNVDLSHSSGAIHYNDHFAQPLQSLESDDGWVAGGQVGANVVRGVLLYGIEADASWTDLSAKGRFTTEAPNFTTWDIETQLSAFGTVRGRLGFLVGPGFLLYGTGGLAWGVVDASQATNWFAPAPPDVGGRTSGNTIHLGWTAGAGAEWKLSPRWSLNAQWLYVDLGEENYALNGTTKPGGTTPYTETFSTDLNFNTVRLGLNLALDHEELVAVPFK
jgi:outer membrane immunogenic protein